MIVFAWGLLLLALAGAWVWGEQRLRRVVADRQSVTVRVDLQDVPAWMPAQVVQELRSTVVHSISTDPFDHDSLRLAGQRLAASPWVHRMRSIVRQPGGAVEVLADYRQRAALVRSSAGYCLVDSQGVRLPFTYRADEAAQVDLPRIHGVRGSTPAIGQAWDGQDIREGLELAAIIAPQPWSRQVLAIDVSNHNGRLNPQRGHLKALTSLDNDNDPFNNAGIEWGRLPGEGRFEPTMQWKFSRIEHELQKHRKLDDRIVSLISEPGITYLIAPEASVAEAPSIRTPVPVSGRRSAR